MNDENNVTKWTTKMYKKISRDPNGRESNGLDLFVLRLPNNPIDDQLIICQLFTSYWTYAE